jgi:hypothetical protein
MTNTNHKIGGRYILQSFLCKIIFIDPELDIVLVEFDSLDNPMVRSPSSGNPYSIAFAGSDKQLAEPCPENLVLDNRWYRWVFSGNASLIPEGKASDDAGIAIDKHGYNCIECWNENVYAEANLTHDRFICFSCRASYGWKYDGEFLSPEIR